MTTAAAGASPDSTGLPETAPPAEGTKPARRRSRPSPGRPTRAHAEVRDRELLDKALDLFVEHGFERTSIEMITAKVGMAKRTVYARYGDKRTLFEAALTRAIEEWIVPVEVLREAEGEDLEQSLLAIGRILVDNILTPAGLRLLQITNAESRRMPEIGAFTNRAGTQATLEFLAELFARRLDLPPLADGLTEDEAGKAALAFLYLVVGGPANLVAWGVSLDAAAIERLTIYNVHLFLNGLLPR